LLGLASLAAGWINTASAGEHFYNFDPPNGDPAANGFIVYGANAANAWHTNTGFSGADGDGFLEITPAANNQTLGVLFPLDYFTNADSSLVALPLKGFLMEADVRIGNATGNNGRPADGFSISFAANTDPVVYWGKQANFRGWAGGDSTAQALEPATFNFATGQGALDPAPCDSGTAENGTKTGVSVQFDTWSDNTIIDQTGATSTGNDNVGCRVHFNGKMLSRVLSQPPSGPLAQSPDPGGADVNGLAVCPAPGAPGDFTQDPTCTAAICADTNSIQTGPYTGDGDVTNLCWAHLSVELTTNTPHLLTVLYKGRPLVDHLALTNFQPYVGQLVMGGRTGGANENRDVDNVHILTYPSVQAIFSGISSASFYINDFSLLLQNIGPAKVTTINALTLDGVDIKSAAGTTITIGDPNSTIKFTAPAAFVGGSQHTVSVTFSDAAGSTTTSDVAFTTTPWTTLPASAAVPDTSIDTTQPGFRILPHQTTQSDPNRMYWADEQLMGLHGTNEIDPGTLGTLINGEVPWANQIDFANTGAGGQFPLNIDWGNLGIPAPTLQNDNNSAISVSAYLYFPTAGMYVMGANSDDALRVTYAKNSHDLLGTQVDGLLGGEGGRGIGLDQNVGALFVATPGYYGFRLLWENGGGGSAVEWYFKSTPSGQTNVLINDTLNNPSTTIKAYQVSSAAPPYVSYAEPPLGDDSVNPDQDFTWKLTDGATTVNSGSIVLSINGVAQSPTITSAGGVTTLSLPHTPGQPHSAGTNTVALSFKDSGNTTYSYSYPYVVGGFSVLPVGSSVPISAVDATKPGFNYTMYQVDQQGGNALVNREHVAEQVLAGLYGPNVATVSSTTIPGFINFDITGPDGNFTAANGFPDAQFPGLPGTGTAVHNLESFAVELSTWVAFPAEGTYTLGFNSDDGFWTKIGLNKPSQIGQLTVVSPASVKGDKLAVITSNRGDGVGAQPTTPITGKLVLASDLIGCATVITNASMAGNIALIERGTCTFQAKAEAATAAGAIAVIVANNRPEFTPADGWFPTEMTGGPPTPIPAVMIDRTNYFALTNAMSSGDVVVTINPFDNSGNIGDADIGRGATDTTYKMYVPAAGAYPLRTVYWQGGGGANAEWFSIANGNPVLLNNVTNSDSLKTYRAVTAVTRPTISVGKQGNSWVITYTGNLYSSPTATGAFTPVSGASNPYTIPTGAGAMNFYRAGP